MGDAQRILVVDDELGPREALRMILKAKYQVMTAVSGHDALQVIREMPPDLVLLDIKMREMSGIEVLRAIKDIDPGIEVIMMTAYASLQTAREAISHGAAEYLIKPFSKKEVEEAITKALTRRAERTGAQRDIRVLLEQLRTLAHTTTPASEVVTRAAGVLAQVQHLLGAEAALLYLRDGTTAPWRCVVARDLPPNAPDPLEVHMWGTLLQQALTSTHPVRLQHDARSTATAALPSPLVALGYKHGLLCALHATPESEGVLVFLSTATRPWRDEDAALGQTVADLLALALHTQQRYHASQQEAAQLSLLRVISHSILGQLELSATLQAIGEQLQAGLGYAGFHVWLTTPANGSLQAAYGNGPNPGWQPQSDTPAPTALQVVDNPAAQVVLAPIELAGRPVGVLKVVRVTPQGALSSVELDLLRMLLDYIALAVHHARLYEEIAATKSFLETLIQDAGDAILTVDLAGRITSWNASAEQLCQATAVMLPQRALTDYLPAESYVQWKAAVEQSGHSLTVETHLTPHQGPARHALLTLSPLRGPHGTLVGLSLILKDVTEERRRHEQALQAEKLRAVGEMAAGIAHNFNNVLTTILTRAQLLGQQLGDTAALQRGLILVEQAASDGASMVRRLQQLARGNVSGEMAWLDVNAVVQEVVETTQPLWQDHARRQGRPIELEIALSPVPQVPGRAAELREVLINLLLNAVEAMPQGGRLILHTRAEDDNVCVTVSDTGTGMTPEVQRRLFDPFFTTKGARGTGLGLSVSQAIIKAHHGTLTADSAAGRGTTFVITLPQKLTATDPQLSHVLA
jgi:PAS domain S-box-containing protein